MEQAAQFGQQVWAAVAPYLAAFVAALIIWALRELITFVKAKVAALDNEAYRALLAALVRAAEQKFNAGQGKDKFAWVSAELGKAGWEVDPAMIEAEVFWLSKFKPATPATPAPEVKPDA